MKLEIKTYPDPVLLGKSHEVGNIDPEIKQLARDMAETMYESRGIGLAAPQVGRSLRLITVDISGPEKRSDLKILINPVVVSAKGQVESEEGCLSCPEFKCKVTRAAVIEVEALDLTGERVRIVAKDLLAICLQHEIDHLDGVVLVNYASRLKKALYEKKIKKWKKRGL